MRESTRRKLFLIIICIQRWFLMALLNERTGISIDKHVYHVPCINPPSTKHCKPHWLTSRLHAYDNLKVYAATRKLLSELCIQKLHTTHTWRWRALFIKPEGEYTNRKLYMRFKTGCVYRGQSKRGLAQTRMKTHFFGRFKTARLNAYQNAVVFIAGYKFSKPRF